MKSQAVKTMSPGRQRAMVLTGALILALAGAMSSPARAQTAPLAAAELQGQGRLLFDRHCAGCHGAAGDGRGDRLGRLGHPAGDLRLSPMDAAQQAQIVIWGGDRRQRSPDMPAWGAQLSAEEVTAVVLYTQSLKGASGQATKAMARAE
jgi:mono/diheme cytochrome c family protein